MYYTPIPPEAYIIEVLDADHVPWTAMATEPGGILRELEHAPPATLITIFHWTLAYPTPSRDPHASVFTRGPTWKFVRKYPWTLEATNG